LDLLAFEGKRKEGRRKEEGGEGRRKEGRRKEEKEGRAKLYYLYIITVVICALLYIQKLMEKKY